MQDNQDYMKHLRFTEYRKARKLAEFNEGIKHAYRATLAEIQRRRADRIAEEYPDFPEIYDEHEAQRRTQYANLPAHPLELE